MKRRVSERVLVLILSMAVLLTSTGVYSVFAETYSDSASSDSSTTVSSSSSAAETTTSANSEPNVVAEGGSVETEKLSGTGSDYDPYLISDADDLFKMQDIVNDSKSGDKYFALEKDIDLSSVSYAELRNNSVTPGTIVSVDKSKSEAAPNAVKFILDGRNHKIYGLNVTNTGSERIAIFGYVSAKSVIKYVDFKNIKVNVSYKDSIKNSAVVVENNGEFRDCSVDNVTINVDDGSNNKYGSTGIIAVNTGKVSNVTVSDPTVKVQSGRKDIGVVVGNNYGTISNVKVVSATVKAGDCDSVGVIAGKNTGEIEYSTVNSLKAEVEKDVIFGAVAGKNSGTVTSCVTSGVVEGSDKTGGIVGKAFSSVEGVITSNVKDCYSFVRVEENTKYGAVIATGESRYSNNIWSSETCGREKAYSDGTTDGNFVREDQFIVVKKGESKSISKSSLSGTITGGTYALDTSKDISFKGDGVSCKKSSDSIIISASESDKIGYLTFAVRVNVYAGYRRYSSVTKNFSITVLTVPEGTNGDGLSESTALEISNGAELRMISKVPYAHFRLDKDITMPDNWDSSFVLTGSVNGNGHKVTASQEFCESVNGKISNLNVTLKGKISNAIFGKAEDAVITGVRLTKAKNKNSDSFIGLVASKSGRGAFLNSVSGNSVISDCYSNIPVRITSEDIKNVAGFIGVLKGDNVVIKSCGVSSSVKSKYDKKYSNCAAFIGKADENKNGKITDCYATLYSDVTNYVLVGGGDEGVRIDNSIYTSKNKKAVAAPEKFTSVNAEKWHFEAGEYGFVTGKGSTVSIALPSVILNSGKLEPKDFKAMYDAEDIAVNLEDMVINNGVVYIPVEITKEGSTVRNSSLVVVHKSTGLLAEIGISNGLEKGDDDSDYTISSGADFTYINDNFEKFSDESFVITKDIDMSCVDFSTVGGSSDAFTGKIDGKGHTISGLKVDEKAKSALFGKLDGATIKNIVFEDAVVNASGSYAGVLAAQITGGTKISSVTFNNCKVNADENFAGILAGEIEESSIKNIEINDCKVVALNSVGAVAGTIESAKAESVSVVNANVSGNDSVGLFGEAKKSEIKAVEVSESSLKAKQNVGGIVGTTEEIKVSGVTVKETKIAAESDSFGAAPVAGGVFGTFNGTAKDVAVESVSIKAKGNAGVAGGIAAISENASLKSAETDKNTKVSASVVGGIIGEATDITEIKNSKSVAKVTGSKETTRVVEGAGGVIGRVTADDFSIIEISETNVSGSVSAADYAGGIIGSVLSTESDGISVADCVSAAKINETVSDNKVTSGHVIGFVTDLSNEDISDAVSGIVFSSYDSELGAYGNIDADKTYSDLDTAVESSLSDAFDGEKVVKVSNSQAEELGFEFNNEKGWQSDSENRVEVVNSSENKVKLSAEKTGVVSIVGTYVLPEDEEIELNVHFDAETEIEVVLSGEGTKESPYIVSNASELEAVSKYAGEKAYFEVTNDITFNAEEFDFGGEFYHDGKGFESIGTKDVPFNGVFNGNGHKISGIQINGTDDAGLFGYVSGATISGIKIKDAEIKADKLASAFAASVKDSQISDITVNQSKITAQSTDGSAAAVAAYAENTTLENITVSSTDVAVSKNSTDNTASCAGALCARAIDVTVNDAEIKNTVTVETNGASAGFIGYCDNVIVSDSEVYAEVSGNTSAAMAATVKGQLNLNNVILGGKVTSDEFAAGIAAKAEAVIKANDVVVSSQISGNGEKAIVAAYADESVFTDSDDCGVEFNNVVYSGYKNSSLPFASEKINAYQNAKYIKGVIDVNSVTSIGGGKLIIGKNDVKLFDTIKSDYDLSKFACEDVYSVPENAIEYNKSAETVSASDTVADGAVVVISYDNGLKVAVDVICIKDMTGEGTESLPYIVRSEEALEILRLYPQSSFKIDKDIALTKKWTPVEDFTGTLDGAGHVITNLCVEAENAGLFASLSKDAVVKNVTIRNAVIEGKTSAGVVASVVKDNAKIESVNVESSTVKAEDYAAAIAGTVKSADSVISSCQVSECTISADNAAGIAAFVNGKVAISSAKTDGNEIKGGKNAGGVVALASAENLSIKDCEISSDVSADNAGGIVGANEKVLNISECKVEGTVTGKNTEGGIIGLADGNVSVTGCKALAELSGKADNVAEIIAKFVTRPEDNEQFAKDFADNTINGNFDEFEAAVMQYQYLDSAEREESDGALKGAGTEEDPYVISSAKDLSKIPDSSTAYFVLDSDITITEKHYSVTVNKAGKTVKGVFSEGYRPIKDFAGVFDGNGHVIKGLYIDSDADYVGLFANVTANGTVKNLHVEILEKSEDSEYYGIKGNDYVGGIAGYCDSVNGIENCSVSGSVISGGHAVGGLVGGLASSKIVNSFAMSQINAQNKAGGIAGVTSGSSTIMNSFAACEVNAAGGTLVGSNNGILTLTDVMVNGVSHGTGSVAVAENSGTIKATKVLIAGANEDKKESIINADETKYVYSDRTTLGITEENIKSLTTSQLTSSKPEGLEKWTQEEGKYPVPAMADEYSDTMAITAANPSGDESEGSSIGNVSVTYTLVNKTGEKDMDTKLTGILIKSKSNGATVTSDFFTNCTEDVKPIDKLIVTTGGFYVDSSLPAGYEFSITAKNTDGNRINVSDAGAKGSYVECGAETKVKLEISIIKTETPWGLTSLWESLVR